MKSSAKTTGIVIRACIPVISDRGFAEAESRRARSCPSLAGSDTCICVFAGACDLAVQMIEAERRATRDVFSHLSEDLDGPIVIR